MANPQTPQAAVGELKLFAQASFPELYEQALVGPLFRPWVDPLLDEGGLRAGDRVLDIACGTGIVARVARERLGSEATVAGVDVNAQMLEVARRVEPGIDWREGSATSLPLQEGEQFDVVVCQQGFQFFPDRWAAAREMRRALVSGGRVGVSTWRPDGEYPLLRRLREIAERHVGPVDDRRHSLGDPAPIEAALREAGFEDVRSTTMTRQIRFPEGPVFVRLNAMAMVGMSRAAADLDEAGRQQAVATIAAESEEIVRSGTGGDGFTYDIGTNLVVGRAGGALPGRT